MTKHQSFFPGPRRDDLAFDPDEISYVNRLHEQVEPVRELVLLKCKLHGARIVEHVAKRELAEPADRDDPAGRAHRFRAVGKRFRIPEKMRFFEPLGIREHTGLSKQFYFLDSDFSLVGYRTGLIHLSKLPAKRLFKCTLIMS